MSGASIPSTAGIISAVSFSDMKANELMDSGLLRKVMRSYARTKSLFSHLPHAHQVSILSLCYGWPHPILGFQSRWIRFCQKEIGLTVGTGIGVDE